MKIETRFQPLFLLLLTTEATLAESPIPQPWPIARYEAFSQQSPFALATATTPVAIPHASFAANWFVSGIGRLGDTDFVTIKARDLTVQFSLFGSEPHHATGVVLTGVNWSETTGKSTVIVRKGHETAQLEFNEAEIRASGTVAQTGANPLPAGAISAPQAATPIPPTLSRRARMISNTR